MLFIVWSLDGWVVTCLCSTALPNAMAWGPILGVDVSMVILALGMTSLLSPSLFCFRLYSSFYFSHFLNSVFFPSSFFSCLSHPEFFLASVSVVLEDVSFVTTNRFVPDQFMRDGHPVNQPIDRSTSHSINRLHQPSLLWKIANRCTAPFWAFCLMAR